MIITNPIERNIIFDKNNGANIILVLQYIKVNSYFENGDMICNSSASIIGRKLKIGYRAATRAIKALETFGLIQIGNKNKRLIEYKYIEGEI